MGTSRKVAVVSLALVVAVAAYGGAALGQVRPPKPVMSAGSQVAGSLYVTYVAAWANLLMGEFDGLNLAVEPGGSSQNVILVHTGETDFGITSSSQAYQGYHGIGWSQGVRRNRIAALHPAYPAILSVFTLRGSDIRRLEDLEGKQLGVGVPGGGSDVLSRQLMEFLGIRPRRFVNASWEDTGGLLRDGLVDAVFYIAGHPAGFVQELEISHDLRFLQIPRADMEAFQGQYPYYGIGTLAGGTYEALTGDLETLVIMNFMIGDPDLPDDFVTALLDAVYGHVDVLAQAHPDFVQTNFANVASIPIPFHPAAERYYRERGVRMNVATAPRN